MNIKETVFEKYQIRKSKKQKTAFIDYVKGVSDEMGYECKVEKSKFWGGRNIVVGDPDKAKVVYTAHYDTCAKLPFPNFITPKNFGIYILYNVAIVLGFLLVMFALGFGIGVTMGWISNITEMSDEVFDEVIDWAIRIGYLALVFLVFFGPANKHTANDNTSGVMTLLTLMQEMPVEQREKAAFVFFDLEEAGLFGSSAFAIKHKKLRKNTLVVNFDCVSDGDNFIFCIPKKAKDQAELFEEAYKSDKFNVEVLKKGYFYPSDQSSFQKGVGVAALNKSKGGILYMNKIHTKKDTVYQEENIDHLVKGSIKLTEMM